MVFARFDSGQQHFNFINQFSDSLTMACDNLLQIVSRFDSRIAKSAQWKLNNMLFDISFKAIKYNRLTIYNASNLKPNTSELRRLFTVLISVLYPAFQAMTIKRMFVVQSASHQIRQQKHPNKRLTNSRSGLVWDSGKDKSWQPIWKGISERSIWTWLTGKKLLKATMTRLLMQL